MGRGGRENKHELNEKRKKNEEKKMRFSSIPTM
jgi:hypothetical protein